MCGCIRAVFKFDLNWAIFRIFELADFWFDWPRTIRCPEVTQSLKDMTCDMHYAYVLVIVHTRMTIYAILYVYVCMYGKSQKRDPTTKRVG